MYAIIDECDYNNQIQINNNLDVSYETISYRVVDKNKKIKSIISNDTINNADSLLILGEMLIDSLAFGSDSVTIKGNKSKVKGSDSFTSKVTYMAQDSILVDIVNNQLHLYSAAEVKYDGLTLNAHYIRLDQKTMTAFATGIVDSSGVYVGRPFFQGEGMEVIADSLAYNLKTKKAKLWSGVTKDGDGFIRGGEIKMDEENEGFLRNGLYTTCSEPEHVHFGLDISKAKITKNTIIAGPAYLFIEGIPTPFALPFGFYPKKEKRANGIIFPAIGEDKQLGFFLRDLGYYVGVGDIMDFTFLTSFYTGGSYALDLKSRYVKRYNYNGHYSISYSDRKIGEPGLEGSSISKDFRIRWTHSQFNQGTGGNLAASVNVGSSSYYRNSADAISLPDRMNNTLASSVSYSKSWRDSPFNLSTAFTSSQQLDLGTVSIGFPAVNFGVARFNPFDSKKRVGEQKWYHKISMSYNMRFDNQLNTYDSLMFTPQARQSIKTGFQHSIPIQTNFNVFNYINVNPSINYRSNFYTRTIEKNYNYVTNKVDTVVNPGLAVAREYSLNVSASTTLYGMKQFENFTVKAIRHMMRPSIGYSYRPDYGESRYGHYGSYTDVNGREVFYSIYEGSLYGGPARGKSNSLNFSVGNNFEMKVKSKKDTIAGEKKVTLINDFTISTSYNFSALEYKLAPISMSGFTNIYQKLNLNFGGVLNPYALDQNGNQINKYLIQETGKLFRLTSAYISMSTSFNSQSNGKRVFTPQQLQSLNMIDPNPNDFIDFTIPWNLNLDYSLNYSNSGRVSTLSQIVNISGDFSITPKWKINGMTGYNLTTREVSQTSLGIIRDLHCWDLSINWIPFGQYKSFYIDLKVRAPALQDMKLSKRSPYYYDDY